MGDGGRSRRVGKWILLTAFVSFIPVPFFMLVVGGLVPLAAIGHFAIQGIVIGLPKLTLEAFFMVGILLIHVLVFGVLLYLAANLIARLLFWMLPPRAALVVVLTIVVALFAISLFEVYRLPGHNSAPPANILRVFREFATSS